MSFTAGPGTTYLLTSTQPIPSGTANGVLYLDGSKVVTSGSALQFSGTALTVNLDGTSLVVGTGGASTTAASFRSTTRNQLRFPSGASFEWHEGVNELMRLNSTGLGIGTSSPGAKLEVAAGTGFPTARFTRVGTAAQTGSADIGMSQLGFAGSTNADTILRSSYGLGLQVNSAGSLVTALVADLSGNIGVGTISPDAGFHVNKTVSGSGLSTPISIFSGGAFNAGTAYGIGFHFADVGSAACPVGLGYAIETSAGDTAGSLAFYTRSSTTLGTAPTERMRINSAGNLGLGVGPSAWQDSGNLQLPSGRGIAFGGNAYFYANAFSGSGGNTYISTASAAQYSMESGAHRWFIAPSGTAGNTITFTQAMTLDTSGNLGIGTTSPGLKLHIVSNGPLRMGQASDYFDFRQSNNNLWSWISDSSVICMQMNGATGAVVIGGLVNTTATDGFLYVPTCAGTPTGTPNTYTGRAPIVIDTTNNKLYFYSGGQWRDAGP